MNLPEKIIFVIDTAVEPNATEFQTKAGEKYSVPFMAKRVVEVFMQNKLAFDTEHEFAIMTLDSENVFWECDFTRNDQEFVPSLESIKESKTSDEEYFDLHPVFKIVHQHVFKKPDILKENAVRIILLYSRSNIIPRVNIEDETMQELVKNENFYLDILYIHEPDCPQNKCQEIYTELRKLEIRNSSYIMEVSRNAVVLHDLMAKLLAHPKQRVSQKRFNPNLHPSLIKAAEERRETETS